MRRKESTHRDHPGQSDNDVHTAEPSHSFPSVGPKEIRPVDDQLTRCLLAWNNRKVLEDENKHHFEFVFLGQHGGKGEFVNFIVLTLRRHPRCLTTALRTHLPGGSIYDDRHQVPKSEAVEGCRVTKSSSLSVGPRKEAVRGRTKFETDWAKVPKCNA